jgi:hypothetical protein
VAWDDYSGFGPGVPTFWERLGAWFSDAGATTKEELIIILGLGTVGFLYGRYNCTGKWVLDDEVEGIVGWIVGGELARIFIGYFSSYGMPGSKGTIIAAAVVAVVISRRKRRRRP